ncbi:DUF6493 family protein [Actinoplanes sp. TRM 88003]|uniref:DUF6493 family protein n=1 Tax=Paractinoplanes aksuensis TaxID=2939490 RepID=A0ABT1DDZ2_9ACTN|nr:DUF6493 family protein [Actinoplanes aksuensis]MCO8269034.1 DUF6493 family protein [Actinoplanes aksuensis]
MASVDEIVAALADVPATERVGWRFADQLSWLTEPVQPPEQPVPDWFVRGVERLVGWLATTWPQRPLFHPIRALDRAGIVTPPHDDAYILALVSALGDRGDAAYRLDAIRGDDELRDELIWRVFEVEGGGEVSLTNVDKFSTPGSKWADAFRTLVTEGTLPRDRVLTSCLAALGRDFSAYRAGFFSQLYDSLAPTPAELTAMRPRLLRLLASTVPATVGFATRHLATIELDDDAFLDACPPALVVPAKNTPLTILRLVTATASRRPERAAEVAAVALEHRHRDVQMAALTLLRDLGAGELVAGRLDLLEPSVAQQAGAWFGLTRDEEQPLPSALPPSRPADRTPGERAAALLAGETDPWEIEQFLAEVAAGRATQELRRPARRVLEHHGQMRHVVAALLLDEKPELHHADFLAARIDEIQRRPGPCTLLATPTDRAGWLDPAEFVRRLTATGEPMRYDLIAAMLRLHPDGRADALRAAPNLPPAVRYALGGEPAEIDDHALWVAAARTRAPLDDDAHLIAAGLTGAGEGHAARLTLRLTADPHRYQDGTTWRTFVNWEPHIDVEPRGVRHPDRPTVPTEYGPDWDVIRWQAQIWPHDAETFLAPEISPMMFAAHGESDGRAPARLDAMLVHPGRLGPMAAAVLAAALTAHDGATRLQAAEALTTLVPHRIPVATMADAMVLLAGHATATRWASALRNTSNPHTVIAVLNTLLPQLPYDHRGLHALVGALLEESLRISAVPPEALCSWLRGFTGSSKAARTARELLKPASE